MSKKKLVNKIIKEIKPAMYNKIISHKGNLLDDHLLDSFDIIQICLKIEKYKKKKINISNYKRKNFSTLDEILKII